MKRVLVLGGYGGFGARLSRRLAGRGFAVLVAGRQITAARAFCSGVPGTEPIAADRDGDIAALLGQHRPDLVIDAAGPFQGSGYHVPEACIASGIAYLDLADAREFVGGIAALDGAAKTAGVAILSGASSVPALSGAVIRWLAEGLDEVRAIDIAISASNRATAGPSVSAAILSYVGKPVRLWRGGRWMVATGWQSLRRVRFDLGDGRAILRLVALADVPDHAIVPREVPGAPATVFRAGPEFAFQTLALWLLSWPVRFGWIASLAPFAGWLRHAQGLTARLGSDRSAMAVRLKGFAGEQAIEKRWTLIAEQGDGPEIPTMAAELLAGLILAGEIAPGARHAGGLLPLDQFDPLFAALAIRHRSDEHIREPAYRRAMGERFDRLPPAVRAMHRVFGDAAAEGRGTVTRGRNPIARMIGAIMRFPPEGEHDVHVTFAEENGAECWTRDFAGHHFASTLAAKGERIVERFGPLRFHFDLPSDETGLAMLLRRWSFCGLPLPMLLAPRIVAREWEEEGDFRFAVAVGLPGIGEIVGYGGQLLPAARLPVRFRFEIENILAVIASDAEAQLEYLARLGGPPPEEIRLEFDDAYSVIDDRHGPANSEAVAQFSETELAALRQFDDYLWSLPPEAHSMWNRASLSDAPWPELRETALTLLQLLNVDKAAALGRGTEA